MAEGKMKKGRTKEGEGSREKKGKDWICKEKEKNKN